MKKNKIIAGLCCLALSSVVVPVLAGDPNANQCLECHEPLEDWQGMTVDEIVADAKAPGNKRHKDNEAISDEEMRLIVARLMPDAGL
jgi:hypothetical protein